MKYGLILVFGLLCFNAWSQELKTKKKSGLFYKEIYTVDKRSKKNHGSYFKLIKSSGDTVVKGSFDQGEKTGIWTYNNSKGLEYLKYDHSLKQSLSNSMPFMCEDSIQIRKNETFTLSKVDRYPTYVGAKNEAKQKMHQAFKPPKSSFNDPKSGICLLSFVVNKRGEIQEPQVESSYDPGLNDVALASLRSLDSFWIPARSNGENVDAKMYVVFNLAFTTDPSYSPPNKFRDKADLMVIDLFYLGVAREVSYPVGR